MNQLKSRERAKQRAAVEAARMAQTGWIIGLGTGSTAAYAIEELGRRMRQEGASFLGVPTSHSAEMLARRHGVPIRPLEDTDKIDLAIDGADEVDPARNLIKGAGGAHTREKIIDYLADWFVVVVDETKLVERLGTSASVPVEVLPAALALVTREIEGMGGLPHLRTMETKPGQNAPFITEQGNGILEVRFPAIEDPKALEWSLNNIPGVVENGIFAEKAHLVLVSSLDGGEVRRME